MKLVEGSVAKLNVPRGKRDIQVFDDALPGFGIRKFASGKAFYFVKYNIGRRQRKMSLGPVVPGALAAKRKVADEVLTRARLGQDVAEEKRAAKAKAALLAANFGKLVPTYLDERKAVLRPASHTALTRYLQLYWSRLHPSALEAIQRPDIVFVIDQVATDHGAVAADRARVALGGFFAWAIDRGHVHLNPVQNIARRSESEGRSRVLTEAELGEVWRSCLDDDYGWIVRLLILTGQRKTEIGSLRHTEVVHERRQIELPGERTKNGKPHVLPLSDEALTILAAVPERKGRAFVFGIGKGGFSGWSKAKAELDGRIAKARKGAGVKEPMPAWVLHDVRRSFVSHVHEREFAQPHVVEAIVNHVSGHRAGVAGVYNKAMYLPERRRALERWGQHVLQLAGKATAEGQS